MKELFFPTVVGNLSNIKANHETTDAYQRILKQQELGSQYEFLVRYCLQEGLDNVEMSVETGSDVLLAKLIKPLIIKVTKDNYSNYELIVNMTAQMYIH